MASKAQLEANKRYIQAQDNVTIRMPKGKKEIIQTCAKNQNKSLNSYINEAIDEKMERDNTK